MEKEIQELKRQLASTGRGTSSYRHSTGQGHWSGSRSDEAIAGLLNLQGGTSSAEQKTFRKIEDVMVSRERVEELFKQYEISFMDKIEADNSPGSSTYTTPSYHSSMSR